MAPALSATRATPAITTPASAAGGRPWAESGAAVAVGWEEARAMSSFGEEARAMSVTVALLTFVLVILALSVLPCRGSKDVLLPRSQDDCVREGDEEEEEDRK
jgi:hypothetical protein